MFLSVRDNVDEDMLLVHLFGELMKDQPKAAQMILEEHGHRAVFNNEKTVASSPVRKKTDDKNTSFQPFETTFPKEIIAKIASFLSRVDSNSFGLTNKNIHKVIQDPSYHVQRYPSKCPFPELPHKFFCLDKSHFGVFQGGVCQGNGYSSDDDDEEEVEFGRLQVWSREFGLVKVFKTTSHMLDMKPTISLNGEYLALEKGWGSGNSVVCIYKLPKDGSRGLVAELEHTSLPSHYVLKSAAFLDNNMFAACERTYNGIFLFKVWGLFNLTVTGPETILYNPKHEGVATNYGNTYFDGCLACFSTDEKKILALVYDVSDDTIVIHDPVANKTIECKIPSKAEGVLDLAFSLDGKTLAVGHKSFGLSTFHMDIEDIEGTSEAIPCEYGNRKVSYNNISFNPCGTKIVACRRATYEHPAIYIIEAQTGEILSRGWDTNSSWKQLFVD